MAGEPLADSATIVISRNRWLSMVFCGLFAFVGVCTLLGSSPLDPGTALTGFALVGVGLGGVVRSLTAYSVTISSEYVTARQLFGSRTLPMDQVADAEPRRASVGFARRSILVLILTDGSVQAFDSINQGAKGATGPVDDIIATIHQYKLG